MRERIARTIKARIAVDALVADLAGVEATSRTVETRRSSPVINSSHRLASRQLAKRD